MMTQGVAFVLVALVVLELRLASARALPGETAYVARKGCPAPRECCRYLEHSGKFKACCNTYGCCPDCDDIYVYRGHGPYEVRQDCVGAYECCLYPFLSEEFHKCCFEHGCCPLCGNVADGCSFNNVMYSWRSVVLALPRCCLELVCGVKMSDASPPYLTAVIIPISYPPTSEDQVCDLVKNDYCVDHLGIIRADGSEWLENPCRLCRCDNGHVSCHYVPPQDCPPAPQPHCRELPGDCCPSWDCDKIDWRIWSYHFNGIMKPDHRRLRTCIDEEGSVHEFGDQWWDQQDPCVFRTCTENGITRTRRGCPQLPPRPHPACHLSESDDGCCFTWRCSICTDEDGALHRLGDGWLDPYDACVYYVCTVEGIRRGLGDCSHLSYRPRQGCLLLDDEKCCQGECTTCVDEEGETHEIGDEWQDRHDSCFYYTCTDDGITRAPKDCPELPPRPHRDCHLFKEEDECCQTWRCLGCVFDGLFHGYGEGWREPTNPCIQYLCTVNNISKVYEHCPAAPSKPHLRCQLIRPDGQCCMEWKCPGCPDPHSFDRVCERSIDLCQSDFECKLGHQCCLVAGCGKECLPVYHPCYATPMCQRMGGRCSDTCGRDEGLITGVCSSDDCVCCVPQAGSCKFETMACRERDGRCDSTCGSEEDPIQGLCLNDNCLCCVPKPHRPCLNTSFCNLLDGRCARNCSRGENAFSSMCGASDCVCCIPEQQPPPCQTSLRCLQQSGRCASECGRGEIPVLGVCHTRSCVCCVPEPKRCDIDTFACRLKGGHCDQTCGRDEEWVKHLCDAEDCFCCVPKCSATPFACRSKGGHCDVPCGHNEMPFKHLCGTDDCLCCVPGKQRRCHDTSLCLGLSGECATDCGRGENPVQGVCGSRGCVCCVPEFDRCTSAIGCFLKGGHCERTCGRDEESVEHLCNSNDCICCLPKFPQCNVTTFACRSSGGHCDQRCGHEEDPVRHLCTTADCLCCVPKPARCRDSILCQNHLGGQCARECGRGETHIEGVCEARHCVCCVSGVHN